MPYLVGGKFVTKEEYVKSKEAARDAANKAANITTKPAKETK